MDLVLALVIAVLGMLAGWGWHMSPSWFRLSCRTCTVYGVLYLILLLFRDWITNNLAFLFRPPYLVFSLVGIVVALFFFKELIPFPILQFFKGDGITTIRIGKKLAKESLTKYGRDMKHSPERFIFPYILDVNISPIMKNYLQVRCCFFSALPYHLDLDKISIYLIINGTPTKRQPILEGCIDSRKLKKIESVTLYAEVPNERGFRIYLMKTKREEMLKYFQQNKAAEVCVHVIGFDKQGKEYNLQTNYPKIALLNE